jgi:sporulation protein YqfC
LHILYISVSCYAGVRYGKDVRSVVMPQSVTMPILTVIGNKEMYIENFKSIMEYECDSVKVITRRGIVHVKGSDLDIGYLDMDEISIKGRIKEITFE